MEYVVFAEWRGGAELTTDDEVAFAEAFRPTDASVCVWTSPEDAYVLMVAFEVGAQSYEAALDAARAELDAAGGRAPSVGRLTRVMATDDDGYRAWSV